MIFCFILSSNLLAQGNYETDIKLIDKISNSRNKSIAISVTSDKTVNESIVMDILFKYILFRGVQGSPPMKALLSGNEFDLIEKHKSYFISFHENKKYKSFIIEKNCNIEKDRKKKALCTCFVTINIQSLKEDLKNNKILHDYGF